MKKLSLAVLFSIISIANVFAQELPIEKSPTTPAFFPGGDENLFKFIQLNLKYPDSAKANNIEGTVYIKFIIDTMGNVVNPTIIKQSSPILVEEALRVVSMLTKFSPATKDGRKVNTELLLPLNFKLND